MSFAGIAPRTVGQEGFEVGEFAGMRWLWLALFPCALRRQPARQRVEHQRHLETVCMDVVLCFGRGLVTKLQVPCEAVRQNAHLKRHRGATYRPLVRPTPYAGDTKCGLHTNDSKCTGHTARHALKRYTHRHSGGWEGRHFPVKCYPPATRRKSIRNILRSALTCTRMESCVRHWSVWLGPTQGC